MPFYVGLDLGQSADFTALSVVQTVRERNGQGGVDTFLHLRHLERYPLRTLYPDIADSVAVLMRDERLTEFDRLTRRTSLKAPELVVDNTGVGAAAGDLLRKKGLRFKAVTITGGDEVTYVGGGKYRVPKRDLVGALEVPFHTGKLKVAEDLPLWGALREELLNFRRKINLKTAHDSYEHWRETDHDDLVLATALACWWIAYRSRGGSRSLRLVGPKQATRLGL